MARPRKAGFFIEADALHHWRFEVAGAAGTGLWAFAGAWCDAHLSDGHIPLEAVVRLLPGAKAAIARVTKSGLWTECVEHAECFVLHAYAQDGRGRSRQKTRAQLELEREAQRARDERKRPAIPAQFPDSSRREPPGNVPGTVREPDPLDNPTSYQVPPLSPPQGGEPTKRRRPRTIPDDFEITPSMRSWAAEHVPNLDVDRSLLEFVSYWRGAGKAMVDWEQTWRNGMLKADSRGDHRRGKGSVPPVLKPFAYPDGTL